MLSICSHRTWTCGWLIHTERHSPLPPMSCSTQRFQTYNSCLVHLFPSSLCSLSSPKYSATTLSYPARVFTALLQYFLYHTAAMFSTVTGLARIMATNMTRRKAVGSGGPRPKARRQQLVAHYSTRDLSKLPRCDITLCKSSVVLFNGLTFSSLGQALNTYTLLMLPFGQCGLTLRVLGYWLYSR